MSVGDWLQSLPHWRSDILPHVVPLATRAGLLVIGTQLIGGL